MATSQSKKTPPFTGAGVTMDHCAAAAHHGWHNTKSPVVHRPPNDDFSMTAASLVLSRPAATAGSAPASASASAAASASVLAATPRTKPDRKPRSMAARPRSDIYSERSTGLQRQSVASIQSSPAMLGKEAWSMAAARGALEQSFIKPKADKEHQKQQQNTQVLAQALPLRLKQPMQQKRISVQPRPRPPSEHALSAATMAHAPYSNNVSRRASAPPRFSAKPHSMYSASGNDKDHETDLHATALAMAQQMFAEQQLGNNGNKIMRKSTVGSSGPAQDPLHEKAWKLAQARLAQMDDGSLVVRDSQSYYIAKDRTSSRRFSRLSQRNKQTGDQHSDAAEDDGASSEDIDGQPRSIFTKRLSGTQLRKRQDERDALLAAARRNVEHKLAEIDEETMNATGRLMPRRTAAWDAKAQKAAVRRSAERAEAENGIAGTASSGQYNVGGGLMVDKADVEARANENLEPLFTDIKESAVAEHERKEQQRLEEEAKKKENTADKARKGKLSEIGSIFSSQKKQQEKEEKKHKKLAEKKRKEEEKKEKQPHGVLKDSISSPVAITGLGIAGAGAGAAAAETAPHGHTDTTTTPAVIGHTPVAAKSVPMAPPIDQPVATGTPAAELASPVAGDSSAAPVLAVTPASPSEPELVPEVPTKSVDRDLGAATSDVPVMSATVSPDELHDFPTSPTAGLSPINESSTPSPDITAATAAPFADGSLGESTHATTIENGVPASGSTQDKPDSDARASGHGYETAVPAAAGAMAGVGAGVAGANLESPHQTVVDSTSSALHPLQSNPPLLGHEKKRISDNVDVDSGYDHTYDQNRVSSVYDQQPQDSQGVSATGQPVQEQPVPNPDLSQQHQAIPAIAPAAAVGAVGGGLANSALTRDAARSGPTPAVHHDIQGVPSSQLTRDERREASLERARQTQLNAAAVLPKQEQQKHAQEQDPTSLNYDIPVELETSPADRVRSWFRTHVRSRKDISHVGGLDNSDMLVAGTDPVPHALANGTDAGAGGGVESFEDAERSKQKKRSSFLSKFTSGTKTAKPEEKREFVHEPSLARDRASEANGFGVPPVPQHLKQNGTGTLATDERASRFREVMP
ncbi:hypothetical protein BROUX41_005534 [Berkeleyomyces rouxiae]|uniref:uncharacterized protein n=1 Tax=Berkeleyomyces rouxiae TaxID=2035830 RepID=UPI003B810CA8